MAAPFNNWISPQVPKIQSAQATTANTTFTASPTNTQTLWTAPATHGARIISITAVPVATVSGSYNLQLYVSTDAGANKHMIRNRLYSGTWTAGGTTVPTETDFGFSDDPTVGPALVLKASAILYCAIGAAYATTFTAIGYDYA